MLDYFRGLVLCAIDKINIATSPFHKFDRPAEVVDFRSLEEKAQIFWDDIQKNFLHGPRREFYWSMKPNDLGDMAIWHGWYLACCVFKGDWEAASLAMDGAYKLQYLGKNSRLSRGADLHPDLGGLYAVDPTRTHYRDGKYAFIDNCSESSMIGHLMGMWAVLWREDCPEDLKKRAERALLDLAIQIDIDGERMLNQDGSPAKFGDLRPSVTTAPIRIAALACLYLLTYKATMDADYLGKYDKILRKHGDSIAHPETHFMFIHPWYQDILAYMVLTMMITMDPGVVRKKKLVGSMKVQWQKNKDEGNSLYSFLVKICVPGELFGLDGALKTLSEFATPGFQTNAKNPGKAQDPNQPTFRWGFGSKAKTVTRQPIAIWRRAPADFMWQRCPYEIGGEEWNQYNGMDFCVAYYLGKHLGVL